jgi:ABC-2 type transport system permease protein
VPPLPATVPAAAGMYLALVRAGFRRFSTYRQATAAGAFTNVVFGFLRGYALLAAAVGAGGVAAGYDAPRLLTFVWVGQGMIATINLWGPPEHAERIRSGEVVADLLRPVDVVWQLLAVDLGRVGFALVTRFAAPVVVGLLAFDLYLPHRPETYPLFVVSLLLAMLTCFGLRHVVFCSVYWLLDVRGPVMAWVLVSSVLSGMYFPLWFLPDPLPALLVYGTPFPALVQTPLDILVERGSSGAAGWALARQAGWTVAALVLARAVQRVAQRRLVIQGG